MIDKWWNKMFEKFNEIEIDTYQIMPNHIHAIIKFVGAGLVPALGRTGTNPVPTLGNVIGAFKSITTNEYIQCVKNNNLPPFKKRIWQRNYYEHIIRNEQDLQRVRKYIIDNPKNWKKDIYNK
jgi:REP-associated tyrosine transposase